MGGKKVLKVRTTFFIGGGSNIGAEIRMRTHRIRLVDIIQETTDPAELPEYLTDEDLMVVEAARRKLDELTGE